MRDAGYYFWISRVILFCGLMVIINATQVSLAISIGALALQILEGYFGKKDLEARDAKLKETEENLTALLMDIRAAVFKADPHEE